MMIGLVAGGAASAVGALVDGPAQLIAVRAVMGVGAAVLMPITLAVLPALFTGEDRGKAVAILTAGIGLGIPLGPLVGGYLLKHFWWGSIFLVNVPAAALALVAVVFLIPESRDPAGRRGGVARGLLVTIGLGAVR